MLKIIRNRERNKPKSGDDKRWWIFKRKSRIKPTREMKIEHHVDFNRDDYDEDSESYEINKYLDQDNNHYR
jgi:hypothetical protein